MTTSPLNFATMAVAKSGTTAGQSPCQLGSCNPVLYTMFPVVRYLRNIANLRQGRMAFFKIGVLPLEQWSQPPNRLINVLWRQPGVILKHGSVMDHEFFHEGVVLASLSSMLGMKHGPNPPLMFPFLLRFWLH